ITGGWQNWTTVSTTIPLPAGDQVLRIVSTGLSFNINYMDFHDVTPPSANPALVQSKAAPLEEKTTAGSALDVYPNPVRSQATMQVNNELQGMMKVLVVAPSGAVVQQLSLNKAKGRGTYSLSLTALAPGIYTVVVQMEGWKEERR